MIVIVLSRERSFSGGILSHFVLLPGQLFFQRLFRKADSYFAVGAYGQIVKRIEMDVAISVWIYLQVVLMVTFSGIKIIQGSQLYGHRSREALLYGVHDGPQCYGILLVGIENAGPVLASNVVSLPVQTERVDNLEILFCQDAERDNSGIIADKDRFCKTRCAGADILIGGICAITSLSFR